MRASAYTHIQTKLIPNRLLCRRQLISFKVLILNMVYKKSGSLYAVPIIWRYAGTDCVNLYGRIIQSDMALYQTWNCILHQVENGTRSGKWFIHSGKPNRQPISLLRTLHRVCCDLCHTKVCVAVCIKKRRWNKYPSSFPWKHFIVQRKSVDVNLADKKCHYMWQLLYLDHL